MAPKAMVVMATALVTAVASAVEAGPFERLQAHVSLTVRTYDRFNVPQSDLRTAQTLAAAILRAAGIDTAWLNCYVGNRKALNTSPRCDQSPDSADVILRITALRQETDHLVTMGSSLVSQEREAPWLATIFADRVLDVAQSASTNAAGILGLAIAHELGHLLLGTRAHAETGLMRAGWSHYELRRARAADWRFLDEEADIMRRRLRSRMSR